MSDDDICSVCGTYCPEGGGIHPGCKEAIAAARRQALEDAALACEALIDGRFPSAIELDEKLQEAAAAIRALMEKP